MTIPYIPIKGEISIFFCHIPSKLCFQKGNQGNRSQEGSDISTIWWFLYIYIYICHFSRSSGAFLVVSKQIFYKTPGGLVTLGHGILAAHPSGCRLLWGYPVDGTTVAWKFTAATHGGFTRGITGWTSWKQEGACTQQVSLIVIPKQ